MEGNYCGNWSSNGESLEIQKENKIFTCTLSRNNIGIMFENDLVVSEFDADTKTAGIGVYSQIGDGSSIYALWSSNNIKGQLGSGIALKCDNSTGYVGDYNVQYFIGNQERGSFLVKINKTENEKIYKLFWFLENKNVLHGIGFLIGDSLAFAWGNIECKFDFNKFCYCVDNREERLVRQTVKWDSDKIENIDYIRC
ncbi:MAG: hypothetical protein FWG45_00420 [Oscillospiraceae bacterium]|nr:hypothetical protein [Oscillospiraceae bacterium]